MARRNTTADILIENQLWPLLGMVTVDQEQELHKQNSRTMRESFVVVLIVDARWSLKIFTIFAIS